MTMRVELRQNAGEHERFASDAFASQISKDVPIKLNDERIGTARVLGARVIDDGRTVLLSYEVDHPDVLASIQNGAFERNGWFNLVGPGLSFQARPAERKALLFLLGRWGYHAYLWLWRHA
jgi:hypothetical protein